MTRSMAYRAWMVAVALAAVAIAPAAWTEQGNSAGTSCPAAASADGWVTLFDGQNLDCWQNARRPKSENKWLIEDDTMTNQDHANDIGTKCQFKDFDLQLEYKIAKNGNSGVYLRGRIEVQILDSHGKEKISSHDDGGIYDKFAPLVNASKPAGEWNQLETAYVGDRLTVKLNGQLVLDDQQITELTGGALPGGVNDPGPLMLQGDHGKISFRNIKVRPQNGKLPGCAATCCAAAK